MTPDLDWLMGYEVRISKRYRRFMSLVLVAPGGAVNGALEQVLRHCFRDCDALVRVNGYMAVVMSETGKDGGLRAIMRCRDHLPPEEAAFSLATFPFDGHDAVHLLDCAQGRLVRACRGEELGVVANG